MLIQANARITLLRAVEKAKVCAEIGVFRGEFSAKILDVVRPERLYLVDPWENQDDPGLTNALYGKNSRNDMGAIETAVRKRFATQISSGQVEIKKGRSTEMMADMPDDSLDFIYVDGDHRYEGVMADLGLCKRLVKVGGYVGIDDYFIGNWWGDGVIRATHEFLAGEGAGYQIEMKIDNQVLLKRHS